MSAARRISVAISGGRVWRGDRVAIASVALPVAPAAGAAPRPARRRLRPRDRGRVGVLPFGRPVVPGPRRPGVGPRAPRRRSRSSDAPAGRSSSSCAAHGAGPAAGHVAPRRRPGAAVAAGPRPAPARYRASRRPRSHGPYEPTVVGRPGSVRRPGGGGVPPRVAAPTSRCSIAGMWCASRQLAVRRPRPPRLTGTSTGAAPGRPGRGRSPATSGGRTSTRAPTPVPTAALARRTPGPPALRGPPRGPTGVRGLAAALGSPAGTAARGRLTPSATAAAPAPGAAGPRRTRRSARSRRGARRFGREEF